MVTNEFVKAQDFTHRMTERKVLDVGNTNYRDNRRKEGTESMHILEVGRPLLYMYTRHITTPRVEDLHVYGIYSREKDSVTKKYKYQYSMVLSDDVVEKIKDFELKLIGDV